MRKLDALLIPALGSLLFLTACGRSAVQMSSPYSRGYVAAQSYQPNAPMMAYSAPRAAEALVGVEGIVTGDNLKVKGPFFTSGNGKVLNFTPDSFKLEFSIVSYHLVVEATRIDAEKIHFVTIDVNAGKTYDAIGTYRRSGNTTVFEMGPGQQVEKLTVRAIKPGNFETDVVQPGRLFPTADSRGSNTLKFFKN